MNAWWQERSRSERRLLVIGVVFVTMTAYYLGVIVPLHEARVRVTTRLAAENDVRGALIDAAARVRELRARRDTRKRYEGAEPVLTIVNRSAEAAGTQGAIRRIAPTGPDTVALSLDDIDAASLLEWLVALDSQHGIEVERAKLVRAGAGLVDAQLTLGARTVDGPGP